MLSRVVVSYCLQTYPEQLWIVTWVFSKNLFSKNPNVSALSYNFTSVTTDVIIFIFKLIGGISWWPIPKLLPQQLIIRALENCDNISAILCFSKSAINNAKLAHTHKCWPFQCPVHSWWKATVPALIGKTQERATKELFSTNNVCAHKRNKGKKGWESQSETRGTTGAVGEGEGWLVAMDAVSGGIPSRDFWIWIGLD